ncbi:hypothetical protein I6F11_04045 [Ensifer sp. NBAIM29]|nr:hypothetical protein [Ensifer sp. NBAIM29]
MTDLMQKAPADVLDFDIDFARWLPSGDRIVSATSTIEEVTATMTATVDQTEFTDTIATVWLSGGADGEAGLVKTTITTDLGRTKVFCFNIKIRECH